MANICIDGNGDNCEQLRFVNNSNLPYIYDLTNPAEEEQFVAKCRERLTRQFSPRAQRVAHFRIRLPYRR